MTVITFKGKDYSGVLVNTDDRYYMLDMADGTRRLLSVNGVTNVKEVHIDVATVYPR